MKIYTNNMRDLERERERGKERERERERESKRGIYTQPLN